jgi:hypothetical protein
MWVCSVARRSARFTADGASLALGPAPHFVIDLKSDPQGLNWTYAGALNPHNASDHGPAPGGECESSGQTAGAI